MRIHPEGRSFLIGSVVILTALGLLLSWQWPAWWWAFCLPAGLLFLLFLQFFRHPDRPIPEFGDRLVYAPADGKLVAIEKVREPLYLKSERIQLSIFMSIFNVHANRVPLSGEVVTCRHLPGTYLVAWHPKSSSDNEQTHILLEAGEERILIRQIAGAVARRIKTYLRPGQQVRQGQELGFIKFGSRVDVLLPPDADLRVRVGQKVKANIDVLAELPSPVTSDESER